MDRQLRQVATEFGITLEKLGGAPVGSNMSAKARIPVEFYFDEDLKTWHFHLDEPRIAGGAQNTIEEARTAAAEAIAFALGGTEHPLRPPESSISR